jgi:hypothetical protein
MSSKNKNKKASSKTIRNAAFSSMRGILCVLSSSNAADTRSLRCVSRRWGYCMRALICLGVFSLFWCCVFGGHLLGVGVQGVED